MAIKVSRCIAFLLCLLLFSCQKNYEDYHSQGEALSYSLLLSLQKIHTRQDLIDQKRELKRLFNQLADLSIKAKEYQLKKDSDLKKFVFRKNQYSDELRAEMIRVYSLAGGRKLMESYQQEALSRLDEFYKKTEVKSVS